MSEKAPKLPNQDDIRYQFREAANLALIADHKSGREKDQYALKQGLGGSVRERVGRLSDESNVIAHNGGKDRIDAEIYTPDRNAQTVRYETQEGTETFTNMRVKRNGKEKTLVSTNPLVHDMLASKAISMAAEKARQQIEDIHS